MALKPKQASFEAAATLPLAGITALQALRDKGNIQKGQKVLIVGSAEKLDPKWQVRYGWRHFVPKYRTLNRKS